MVEAPSDKVTAAGLAGAVVTAIALALSFFWDVNLEPGLVAGIATALAFVISYFKKENHPASSSAPTSTQPSP